MFSIGIIARAIVGSVSKSLLATSLNSYVVSKSLKKPGNKMTQRGNKSLQSIIAAPAVALGILKLYLHIYSVWRFGVLDYLVSIGLISGGLFLFSKPRAKPVLLASTFLIGVELLKAVTDYYDYFDVFLTLVAVLYLSIPFLRYIHAGPKVRQMKQAL